MQGDAARASGAGEVSRLGAPGGVGAEGRRAAPERRRGVFRVGACARANLGAPRRLPGRLNASSEGPAARPRRRRESIPRGSGAERRGKESFREARCLEPCRREVGVRQDAVAEKMRYAKVVGCEGVTMPSGRLKRLDGDRRAVWERRVLQMHLREAVVAVRVVPEPVWYLPASAEYIIANVAIFTARGAMVYFEVLGRHGVAATSHWLPRSVELHAVAVGRRGRQ